jgi:hypothetical protein
MALIKGNKSRLLWATLTVCIALILSLAFLAPFWNEHSPPFSIPRVQPILSAPVDGPFYIDNAQFGYEWDTRDHLSLWFHPFVSVMISIFPNQIPYNYRLWSLGLIFGVGSLFATSFLLSEITSKSTTPHKYLLLSLLAPGVLGVATGNAEFPTLFFTTLLLTSVISLGSSWVTIASGVLAILTKPNALYMVPMLSVYLATGAIHKDKRLISQSLLGIISVAGGWLAWISIVDFQTGVIGSYWEARTAFKQYVPGNYGAFFLELVRSFLSPVDLRNIVRYSSAVIIPLANIWVAAIPQLSQERHRYSYAVGNLTMLGIALLEGNPNKIIVYSTTIPLHIPIFILAWSSICKNNSKGGSGRRIIEFTLLGIYCILSLLVYSIGTPLGWYY